MRTSSDFKPHAIYWKLFVKMAVTSILSWRLIAREVVVIALVWVAYFITSMLLQDWVTNDSAPVWVVSAVPMLFWTTVIVSGMSAVVACFKSALPAAIAWALVIPIHLFGFAFASKVALLAANVAVIIYVVGFAFHGGRLSLNGGSSESRPPANV